MTHQSYEFESVQLIHPFTYIVAGGTQCGKTTFVSSLIQHLDALIKPRIDHVIIFYKESEPAYDVMKSFDKRVRCVEGINLDLIHANNTLIITDDQMTDSLKDKTIQELFTCGVHHRSISVIFLSQNFFLQGKYARDIRLNTHYLTICKTPSFSSQVLYLSDN